MYSAMRATVSRWLRGAAPAPLRRRLAPDQIDACVAPLTDAEARRRLTTELQQRAGETCVVHGDMMARFIQRPHRASERLAERSAAVAQATGGDKRNAPDDTP